MGGLSGISDFKLESDGQCFFCLDMILVKAKQESLELPPVQKYSVHYLARYLQTDMGKVFSDKRQIDPSLLTKVGKSRLKVELCEKCTSLNETFSGLYRQLEKLEIGINSSLARIQEEFSGSNRSDQHLPGSRSNSSMGNEVSQIVDVLREEVIQKCSKKLRAVSPRIGIEKLTNKQIDAELFKVQTTPALTVIEPETSFHEAIGEFEGDIKTESEPQNENPLSDDDSRSYDMDYGDTIDDAYGKTSDELQPSENGKIGRSKNSLVIISSKSTQTNKVVERKYSFNTETGKWKCSACPIELTQTGIANHYRTVHQKIRFRCVPCGKEFSTRPNYNAHHRNVHVGVRFKCLVCSKLFTTKYNLKFHQRTSGCGK